MLGKRPERGYPPRMRAGLLFPIIFSSIASAQSPPAQPTGASAPNAAPAPPAAQPRPTAADTKALSQTPYLARGLGLMVYPAKQQTPAVQAQDEHECWTWAAGQTGVDPVTLRPDPNAAEAARAQTADATQGATAVGAAKGAAGGAVIGGMSGNAGRGAAIGAVSGAAVGHRKKKQAEAQAAQKAQQQAEAQAQAQADFFKRAMNACLTGRGYTVQ